MTIQSTTIAMSHGAGVCVQHTRITCVPSLALAVSKSTVPICVVYESCNLGRYQT